MRTLDYTTLVINGFIGFLIATVVSALCYRIASALARSVSSHTLGIYFSRLAFVLIFSVSWLCCCMVFAAGSHAGNLIDPDFWYRIAKTEGMAYGALSGVAWIIVALIDRPHKSKPPDMRIGHTANSKN